MISLEDNLLNINDKYANLRVLNLTDLQFYPGHPYALPVIANYYILF